MIRIILLIVLVCGAVIAVDSSLSAAQDYLPSKVPDGVPREIPSILLPDGIPSTSIGSECPQVLSLGFKDHPGFGVKFDLSYEGMRWYSYKPPGPCKPFLIIVGDHLRFEPGFDVLVDGTLNLAGYLGFRGTGGIRSVASGINGIENANADSYTRWFFGCQTATCPALSVDTTNKILSVTKGDGSDTYGWTSGLLLADPASPREKQCWDRASGTTPNRIIEHRCYESGAVRSVAMSAAY